MGPRIAFFCAPDLTVRGEVVASSARAGRGTATRSYGLPRTMGVSKGAHFFPTEPTSHPISVKNFKITL